MSIKKPQASVSMPTFNLTTKIGQKSLQEFLRDTDNCEPILAQKSIFHFDHYLRTGVAHLIYKGDPIVLDCNDVFLRISKGLIYEVCICVNTIRWMSNSENMIEQIEAANKNPVGAIVSNFEDNDGKLSLIACGDEGANDLVDDVVPTISFECLANFYSEREHISNVFKRLQVISYQPSQTQKLSAQEKALHKKNKKLVPPAMGFTLLNNEWHRPSTFLLFDTKDEFTILMGMDEGSYFGCQLQDNPKTIEDAYTSLMPKEIRGRHDWKRQGEWFVVPIDVKDVPEPPNILGTFQEIGLPRESFDSNIHFVKISDDYDYDSGRIGMDGKIYAIWFSLTHDNHEEIFSDYDEGWHTFIRNTAVRSYSQEGVD